jgi:hypothetical protein
MSIATLHDVLSLIMRAAHILETPTIGEFLTKYNKEAGTNLERI